MEKANVTTSLGKFETRNFRKFLQNELIRRCEKNPNYSLRAFAKSLGIYHATLSALLAGKRPITKKTILKLSGPLGLSPEQLAAFTPLKSNKKHSGAADIAFQELTLDFFVATSEWYYDAILELTYTKTFRSDPKWVAKRLGITVSEVKIAVERLLRLEMLSISSDGKWSDNSRNTTTILHPDFTSSALRKYQQTILKLSSESLDSVKKEDRDHSSMTVAIQKKDLSEFKEQIKNFRRKLTEYAQRDSTNPDEVYQLSISLFPLTKNE